MTAVDQQQAVIADLQQDIRVAVRDHLPTYARRCRTLLQQARALPPETDWPQWVLAHTQEHQ